MISRKIYHVTIPIGENVGDLAKSRFCEVVVATGRGEDCFKVFQKHTTVKARHGWSWMPNKKHKDKLWCSTLKQAE